MSTIRRDVIEIVVEGACHTLHEHLVRDLEHQSKSYRVVPVSVVGSYGTNLLTLYSVE